MHIIFDNVDMQAKRIKYSVLGADKSDVFVAPRQSKELFVKIDLHINMLSERCTKEHR